MPLNEKEKGRCGDPQRPRPSRGLGENSRSNGLVFAARISWREKQNLGELFRSLVLKFTVDLGARFLRVKRRSIKFC
jgi:hypothetical protein